MYTGEEVIDGVVHRGRSYNDDDERVGRAKSRRVTGHWTFHDSATTLLSSARRTIPAQSTGYVPSHYRCFITNSIEPRHWPAITPNRGRFGFSFY